MAKAIYKRYDALFSASSGRIVKYQAEQERREQSANISVKYGPIKHLEQEEYKRSFEYQVLQIDNDDHFMIFVQSLAQGQQKKKNH